MLERKERFNVLRIISLLIALVFIIGMVACGDSTDNETTKATEDTTEATKDTETTETTETDKIEETREKVINGIGLEPVEGAKIKILFGDYGRTKFTKDTYVVKEFARQMGNADLEIIPIPLSDYQVKINTMIVGGDLPDMMMIYNSVEMGAQYGPKGLFYPIDTKLQHMPVLQDIMVQYPDYSKIATAEDGHMYAMPWVATYDFYTIGMMISPRVKDFGIDPQKDINTVDDLYNVLKMFKDDDPSMTPFVTRRGFRMGELNHMFGTFDSIYYNEIEGKYKFGPIEENYKLLVEFLRKLYSEELIDRNFRTTFEAEWREVFGAGKAAFTVDNFDQMYAIAVDPTNPDDWFIPILAPEVNGRRYYTTYDRGGVSPDEGGWVINAKTKHIDSLLSFTEWGYSDEGIEFMRYGREGETCVRMPDGLLKGIPEEDWDLPYPWEGEQTYNTLGLAQYAYSFRGLWYDRYSPHDNQSEGDEVGLIKYDRYMAVKELYKENDSIRPTQPLVSLLNEEDRIVRRYRTAIDTLAMENVMKFIKGEKPMDEWDAHVAKIEDMKLQEVLDIYETAYDRFDSN